MISSYLADSFEFFDLWSPTEKNLKKKLPNDLKSCFYTRSKKNMTLVHTYIKIHTDIQEFEFKSMFLWGFSITFMSCRHCL